MIDILIGCHHYSMIYIMIVPVSGLYWKSWGCSSSHSSSPPTSWSPFTKQIFKINMILLHCSSQIVLLIVLYAPILIQAKQSILAETLYLGNGQWALGMSFLFRKYPNVKYKFRNVQVCSESIKQKKVQYLQVVRK